MAVAVDPTFAERLRELRTRSGISQYELARRSGLSSQAVNRLESGDREPTWGTVKKLCKALGVTPNDFVAEDPPAPEPPPSPRPRRRK